MERPSRKVSSTQHGPHSRLQERVRRHRDSSWEKPIARHTAVAFDKVNDFLTGCLAPLILDSGCGTGVSTSRLGAQFPDHLVLGIDQSSHRLARSGVKDDWAVEGNVVLVRAELSDFWRLAHQANWALRRHYLLYPNPWPKPKHLARRWHAHPVFPALLALGGRLELRTNWSIYAEEFGQALRQCGIRAESTRMDDISNPLTPFEYKYQQSGHDLWRVSADLPMAASSLQISI